MELTKNQQFNKRCAEFLGASIFEEEGRWKAKNWNNKQHYPNQITSSTPLTMWGSKEETHHKLLLDQVNESYGRWGKFNSDWNCIMEVMDAIEKIIVKGQYIFSVNTKGNTCEIICSTQYSLAFDIQMPCIIEVANSKKEAVVEAINQFLIWYMENNPK